MEFKQMEGNIDIRPFLSNYIKNHRENFDRNVSDKGFMRHHGPLFGYICLFYENRSKHRAL